MIEERNKEKVGSLYRDVWDQFKKHKGALFGGVVFLLIIFAVIIGPFLWPFEALRYNAVYHPSRTPRIFGTIADLNRKNPLPFLFQFHSAIQVTFAFSH